MKRKKARNKITCREREGREPEPSATISGGEAPPDEDIVAAHTKSQ